VATRLPGAEPFVHSTVAVLVATVADLVLGGTGDGVAHQGAVIADLFPISCALAQTRGAGRAQGLEPLVDSTVAVFVAASATALLGGHRGLRGASAKAPLHDDHAVPSTQPQAHAARIVFNAALVAETVTVVVQSVTHLVFGEAGRGVTQRLTVTDDQDTWLRAHAAPHRTLVPRGAALVRQLVTVVIPPVAAFGGAGAGATSMDRLGVDGEALSLLADGAGGALPVLDARRPE